MTLLDAYALIAFLSGESGAREVRDLLREGGTAIGAVNLAEVVDAMTRRRGVDSARLRLKIEPLLDRALLTIAFEPQHAWRAGELRAKHYHRTRRPISGREGDRRRQATPSPPRTSTSSPSQRRSESPGVGSCRRWIPPDRTYSARGHSFSLDLTQAVKSESHGIYYAGGSHCVEGRSPASGV
ncbi:MAG: PIN domain-containing protein [Solirubrobacteraceae bacterium]